MDGSQQCTSLPDSEPQRDPVVETKEPMNIESLVTVRAHFTSLFPKLVLRNACFHKALMCTQAYGQ